MCKMLNLQNAFGKSTKKSSVDDFSKRLLDLDFKSDQSIKSKSLKWIVKAIQPTIQRHEKLAIKSKTVKHCVKKIETKYCLGCKDYTHKFKTQELKMVNKVPKEK